jgi:hypothetical protein
MPYMVNARRWIGAPLLFYYRTLLTLGWKARPRADDLFARSGRSSGLGAATSFTLSQTSSRICPGQQRYSIKIRYSRRFFDSSVFISTAIFCRLHRGFGSVFMHIIYMYIPLSRMTAERNAS